MRSLAPLLAALALLACGSPPAADSPTASTAAPIEPAGCARQARRIVAFTAPDSQDVIEARAEGPDCDSAIVLFTLRKADGAPLWAHARPIAWPRDMAGGRVQHDGAAMDAFLAEWANARLDTTAALPDWPERENVFKDSLGGFNETPLPRDQYLDVRARAVPRLCFAADAKSIECIFYDAQAGVARKVLVIGL